MTDWRHNICEQCWKRKNLQRQPVRLRSRITDTCCFCGRLNTDGIYVRHDPNALPCKGIHSPQQ